MLTHVILAQLWLSQPAPPPPPPAYGTPLPYSQPRPFVPQALPPSSPQFIVPMPDAPPRYYPGMVPQR